MAHWRDCHCDRSLWVRVNCIGLSGDRDRVGWISARSKSRFCGFGLNEMRSLANLRIEMQKNGKI